MMKITAVAHKEGMPASRANLPRLVRASVTALVIAFSPTIAAEAQHGVSAISCTNPSSGANWQIRIDYDQRTVDSNPADIGDATISWREAASGWKYQLDRKSGILTVTLASSTGGNFLYDQCKLDK